MAPEPPVVLELATRHAYAMTLGVLLLLFVGRVLGQIVVAVSRPAWLPPMSRWYSGLMPYRYLLPTQVVFVVVMVAMVLGVARGMSPLGAPNATAGNWIVWGSYVYATGMVVRSARYVTAQPERRGVLIPIVFHFVLAAFLFVYGSFLAVIPSVARNP